MATIPLTIVPFKVPKTVNIQLPGTGKRQDGMRPPIELNIHELDLATVEQLISDFAEGVMAAHAEKG